MSKTRAEIKAQARAALSANYGFILCITILIAAISGAITVVSAGLATLILSGPIAVAGSWAMLMAYRFAPCNVSEPFTRAFDNVGRKIGGFLWMVLWTFLWSLLFVIPGIVKSYSYAMVPYILGDLPEVNAKDALKLSMRMMDGHKGELFVLHLSFIGWLLLSALTGGILALLYVKPYMSLAEAGFYEEVKADAIRRGILVELVNPV